MGIHSTTNLRRLDLVGACHTVRVRGFRASEVLPCAAEGTLLDICWNELSPDHKAALLGKLETFPIRDKGQLVPTTEGHLLPPGHSPIVSWTFVPPLPTRQLKEMATYLPGEQPVCANQLISCLQGIPHHLLEGLAPSGPVLELERSDNLERELPVGQVFSAESGLLHAPVDGRPLFCPQEGDLLGLRRGFEPPTCRHTNKELIHLLPYSRDALLQHIHIDQGRQELLLQHLIRQIVLLGGALTRLGQPEVRPATGSRRLTAGEALIRQGDDAGHMFIIVEGRAEALMDGQKAGDVQRDEIFGAMAAFTREKCNATVVASEPYTAVVIPKEQFLDLMQNNPRIAHSLIEDMARRIDLLNREMIQLRLRRSA